MSTKAQSVYAAKRGVELFFFMSLLGPRILRVSLPARYVKSIAISRGAYLPLNASRTRLTSPHHQQTIRFFTPTTLLKTPPSSFSSNDGRDSVSENTRTDFSSLDVLADAPPPTTAVELCLNDGFNLSNGVRIRGSGCLLVGGEAFEWRPWKATTPPSRIINKKGQWDVAKEAWALLEVVWPRPGG